MVFSTTIKLRSGGRWPYEFKKVVKTFSFFGHQYFLNNIYAKIFKFFMYWSFLFFWRSVFPRCNSRLCHPRPQNVVRPTAFRVLFAGHKISQRGPHLPRGSQAAHLCWGAQQHLITGKQTRHLWLAICANVALCQLFSSFNSMQTQPKSWTAKSFLVNTFC